MTSAWRCRPLAIPLAVTGGPANDAYQNGHQIDRMGQRNLNPLPFLVSSPMPMLPDLGFFLFIASHTSPGNPYTCLYHADQGLRR